jgi:hypothetical protein
VSRIHHPVGEDPERSIHDSLARLVNLKPKLGVAPAAVHGALGYPGCVGCLGDRVALGEGDDQGRVRI